jgi:pyruvate/2-oxoglutarate dehydrogenase complex dihydrolipoamide dehydrogenase (E3) component
VTFDLAVIGAGSGGLTAAAAAARLGQSVVLFERGEMGGDCLNTGCVPSKALLAAAKAAQAARGNAAMGIGAAEPDINFAGVMDHVASVIAAIAPHDSAERFEGLGVTVVRAAARFAGRNSLEAAGKAYRARRIVIATGSRAAVPPIPGLSDCPYFTNETLFANRTLPRHLLVIGGGPIGLEMAQAHRRLGSEVTVIEAATPLAKDDPELAAVVLDALRREGVVIRSGEGVVKAEKTAGGVVLELSGGDRITGSHLLVAAGRIANTEGLNLEAAGITANRQGIRVDKRLRTSNRLVYAVGDVAGGPQFTHTAGQQAGLVIRHALFRLPISYDAAFTPWVTYTDPELAHAGLSEAEARRRYGSSVRVVAAAFARNDRARAEGATAGMVKIIAGPRGRILGAGIAGAHAGDLIAPYVLAVNKGLTLRDLLGLTLPYPTLGETGKQAALSAYEDLAASPVLRRVLGFLKRLG